MDALATLRYEYDSADRERAESVGATKETAVVSNVDRSFTTLYETDVYSDESSSNNNAVPARAVDLYDVNNDNVNDNHNNSLLDDSHNSDQRTDVSEDFFSLNNDDDWSNVLSSTASKRPCALVQNAMSRGPKNGAPHLSPHCPSQAAYVNITVDDKPVSTVEIPDTSFWKHLHRSDIVAHDIARTAHPRIDQKTQKTTMSNKIKHSHNGSVCGTVEDNNDNVNVVAIQGYHAKRIKTVATVANSEKPSTSDGQMKRPCYLVHTKIATNLLGKSTNRVPRTKMKTIETHGGIINRIEWCAPQFSHLLLSVSMDRCVKIWDIFSSSMTSVRNHKCHSKAVKCATWSKNGRHILSCSYDKTAKVCDVETGKELCCFLHRSFVSCGAYRPTDFNVCVTGCVNSTQCWDTRCPDAPTRSFTHKDNYGQVQDVEFLQDGTEFFTCNDIVARDSADRNIMGWDFSSGVLLSNQIFQERYTCTRLCVHPYEGEFIAQTQGGYIAVFSTTRPYKMNKCKRYSDHQVNGYNVGCDYSPDGTYIVSGDAGGGGPVIYDRRRTTMYRPSQATDSHDVCLDVSWHPVLPSTIATATETGLIHIWH